MDNLSFNINQLLEDALEAVKKIPSKEQRLLFARGVDIALQSAWADYDTREYVFNSILENVMIGSELVGGYQYDPDGNYREVVMMPFMGDDPVEEELWEALRKEYNQRFR